LGSIQASSASGEYVTPIISGCPGADKRSRTSPAVVTTSPPPVSTTSGASWAAVTYLHFVPPDETEWSLQKRLTRSWLQGESTVLDGEKLFLAAWELMTDFRINDSRRHRNRPSIDFVFLDRAGRMVLVELKRKIITPRESWSVICQVTHRAHQLAAGYSHARLEVAYADCHSGADGRTRGPVSPVYVLDPFPDLPSTGTE
jgi:hypothetical protein